MAAVDIVIPLYNKASTVVRAIRSIRAQTFTDWRLIVVDDGSTDDGPRIVTDIDDPRIQLITQPNTGPGAARNKGIQNATAKYIAFLDADDEWYPHYLHNAISAIQTRNVPLVATMYCESLQQTDMTHTWARHGVTPGVYHLKGDEDPTTTDWLISYLHVGTSLMLTEVARRYDGFYDKDRCLLGEDTVFFIRIAINESFVAILPPAVLHHREDSSLSNLTQRPMPPFLADPSVVLDYCPRQKKNLLGKTLAHMALRHAAIRARQGFKSDALDLLRRFPEARQFRSEYRRCMFLIACSRWYPYWVRFKCALGPPARRFLKRILVNLKLASDLSQVDTSGQHDR